ASSPQWLGTTNCMQFGGLVQGDAPGKLHAVWRPAGCRGEAFHDRGQFDRVATENAHDHDAGAASGGRSAAAGRSAVARGVRFMAWDGRMAGAGRAGKLYAVSVGWEPQPAAVVSRRML